jgi:hypothetical protein
MSYWDIVLPTYIENWPAAMHSLSMASIDIPLTVDDAKRLGCHIVEFGECFLEFFQATTDAWQIPDISDIRTRVGDAVASLPNGGFVRLGSRSPKDSWKGHRHGFKTAAGDDPLQFMLDCSERIYEDLTLAIQHDYAPHIFVRQWMTIPPWSEFRCFMEDRKLVGISQYNYLRGEFFPEIVQYGGSIEWAIREMFFPEFRRVSHLDSVVFDVWVKRWTARDNTSVWEVKLVEINPYFNLTDPCLFAWGKAFDGGFRYNTPVREGQK